MRKLSIFVIIILISLSFDCADKNKESQEKNANYFCSLTVGNKFNFSKTQDLYLQKSDQIYTTYIAYTDPFKSYYVTIKNQDSTVCAIWVKDFFVQ